MIIPANPYRGSVLHPPLKGGSGGGEEFKSGDHSHDTTPSFLLQPISLDPANPVSNQTEEGANWGGDTGDGCEHVYRRKPRTSNRSSVLMPPEGGCGCKGQGRNRVAVTQRFNR